MKALTFLIGLFFVVPAMGAVIGVDFNQTERGATQSGFNAFTRANSPVGTPTSETFGDLTVTLVGPNYAGNFNRASGFTNSGAFTYADLMNDFAYSAFAATPLRIQLSGPAILPNTTYTLIVWAVDADTSYNPTVTVSPTALSGTLGTPGTIVDNGTTPTSNFDFSVTPSFTSNASGVIDFSVLGGPGSDSERVNGFQIVVPEPASAALLLGLLPIFVRRNRQTTQAAAGGSRRRS